MQLRKKHSFLKTLKCDQQTLDQLKIFPLRPPCLEFCTFVARRRPLLNRSAEKGLKRYFERFKKNLSPHRVKKNTRSLSAIYTCRRRILTNKKVAKSASRSHRKNTHFFVCVSCVTGTKFHLATPQNRI